MCLYQTNHWSKGDILLLLVGPNYMLAVEATLIELLPEEEEMDGGMRKIKNNRLFFLLLKFFQKVITKDVANLLIMQIRRWRHQGE